MIHKFGIAFYFVMLVGQLAMAQNSAGNILTGEAKADVLQRYSGPRTVPKPDEILIRDFALPIEDVTVDESPAGQLHRDIMLRFGVDEDSSPEVLAQRVQAAFAKGLTDELKAVNIPTQRVSGGGAATSDSALVVEGEFLAIDEGDKTKRIMIGLGRGASDIKTHVTVYSVAKGHSTVVLEFNLSSESGKKPGAAATMGFGALAVGVATGGVSDKHSTVEADAFRMGKLVAKQLESFMAYQKWISNAPVAVATGQDSHSKDRLPAFVQY